MTNSENTPTKSNRFFLNPTGNTSAGVSSESINRYISCIKLLTDKADQAASFNTKNQQDNLDASKTLTVCAAEIARIIQPKDLSSDVNLHDSALDET
ncbi:MAG: hypothetical protein ACHP65_03895, partial [Legionellales bacterium]